MNTQSRIAARIYKNVQYAILHITKRFTLGFYHKINHEENVSKMLDFDAVYLLDIKNARNDLIVSAQMGVINGNIKLPLLF